MKIYDCVCGAPLFFDNSGCTNCGRTVGWCDDCNAIRAFDPKDDGHVCTFCANDVALCANWVEHQVCNRSLPLRDGLEPGAYCRVCALNETVPNLEVEGNPARWARLESAKRRLIYTLDRLGLPYGPTTEPQLRFSFMGDGEMAGLWRRAGEAERVFTGHAEGLVTINIREADDAARESLRVDLGEAHRTLIGHLRHEVGHYYWDVLIRGREGAEADFAALFGDPWDPDYGTALERHYEDGPPENWQERFVSSYATMHPWEDWAESFALWLVMVSVLDTARSLGLVAEVPDDIERMIERYATLGLILNELSREMGLLDYAPVVISEPVARKLAHVHQVMRGGAVAPAEVFR